MKNFIKYTLLFSGFIFFSSFALKSDLANTKYKVLVQMKNYKGEGAYVVVSVLNNDNQYVKTLQVIGDDPEWYQDLPEWWNFQKDRELSEIDAISGATISGGERSTFSLQIDDKWMNKGYKLRFETAVEEVEYYKDDLEIELNNQSLKGKLEGKGFIRYVRLLPVK